MACRVLRRVARRKAHTMADIPLVVNAALALELYFKSLLTLDEKAFPWKHDLEVLFGLLADSSKRKLTREHKKWEKDRIFARLIADGRRTDLPALLNMRRSFGGFCHSTDHKILAGGVNRGKKSVAIRRLVRKPALQLKERLGERRSCSAWRIENFSKGSGGYTLQNHSVKEVVHFARGCAHPLSHPPG
jgi:hypothetical protein